MTLSYSDTKALMERVLAEKIEDARQVLFEALLNKGRTEPEFCAGVIKHGPGMKFTAEEWFDFFKKVPNMLFKDEPNLLNKLTENQRNQLKFELF